MHEVGIPTNEIHQPTAIFSVQLFRYVLYLAAMQFTLVIISLSFSIESTS